MYSINSTSLPSQKIDISDTEEIWIASFETKEKDVCKYDTIQDTPNIIKPLTSKNKTIRQLKHMSWKYKNPYSVSISNHMNYGKSNHMSENILKDEPQEGRTKQSFLSHSNRKYLANYQKSCNALRTEYSFAALIIVMAQTMIRSLLTLLHVLVNIAPIIQMFFFILRFMLDKMTNILKTKDLRQIIVKFTIFILQLLSVYIYLTFIFSFIIFPIIQMAVDIAIKFETHDRYVKHAREW